MGNGKKTKKKKKEEEEEQRAQQQTVFEVYLWYFGSTMFINDSTPLKPSYNNKEEEE